MNCPKCRQSRLRETQVAPDLGVDQCASCGGAWLDKAEIYRFVKHPQRLYQEFVKAFESVYPSSFACPRCAKMMLHAKIETASMEIETCPACGGIWFDAQEVERLNQAILEAVQGEAAAASGKRGRAEPAAPGSAEGRPLTEMELASVFGTDAFQAVTFVILAGALLASLAGLVLAAFAKAAIRPRDVGLLWACCLPVAGMLHLVSRARRARRARARMVSGTVLAARQLAAGPWGEVELTVRYEFGGAERRVVGRCSHRLFSDLAAGALVGVVVQPDRPERGTFVRRP